MSITRRDFLKTSSLVAAWAALASCVPLRQNTPVSTQSPFPQTPTLSIPTAVPTLDQNGLMIHALKRLTYGPTPEMIDKAKRMGLDAFIEEQLDPASLAEPEIDSFLGSLTTLKMTPAERLQLENKAQSARELIMATLFRQWQSQRQVYEMMVEFWSNHFSIFIGKEICYVLKTDDDQNVIRPNALGKFNDLLNASAHSPAMLVFLDNADSRAEAPNENYARELLELHTVGVDGGYTQTDVQQVARVLTGWDFAGRRNPEAPFGSFRFKPASHASGEKQVMGLTIPSAGEAEGNKLLDMLAHHPSTARFISTKLARRFITDFPDAALVDSLAQVFTESNGDTKAMLRAIVRSDAFKNSAGQKMKRPLEFFLSTLRVTNSTFDMHSKELEDHLRLLGQIPFTWEPPNGFPDVAGYWATTSGLLERWNFGMLLVTGQIEGAQVDFQALTKDAASAQDVVDVLSTRFLGALLPADARSILVDFASSGELGQNIPLLAGLILGSPHFQVR